MQKTRYHILLLLFPLAITSRAQNAEVIKSYISTYKDLAIREMQRTGVPASIILAQGIHETMAGTSKLVLKSNNHFGIKCKANWEGETVSYDDDAKNECFRKYSSPDESYKDHSDFLKNTPRYADLFSLDPTDYEGWANGLKKAGYATNPKYPQALIKLIEDYDLQDYTLIALGKSPSRGEDAVVKNTAEQVPAIPVSVPPSTKESDKFKQPVDYPDGEFKINETRVVYARKGTSYLAIANKYNIDLAKIFEFNEISQAEEAEYDQLIYLQRKRKTGNNESHVVLTGETLHEIAQQEAIRLESLQELNGLKGNEMPMVRERLMLTKKSSSMLKLAIKEKYSLIPENKMRTTNK